MSMGIGVQTAKDIWAMADSILWENSRGAKSVVPAPMGGVVHRELA